MLIKYIKMYQNISKCKPKFVKYSSKDITNPDA